MDQSTRKRFKIGFPELSKALGGEFHLNDTVGEEVFHQKDLIQMRPYGVSVTPDLQNTFFFLKDQSHNLTLPVMVNPVEASLILAQLNLAPDMQMAQPHRVLASLMQTVGIELLQCVFVQTKGNRQLVRLYFSGHKSASSIKVYADQAMSLCIALRVPIYATLHFINQSKVVQVQAEGVSKNLVENQKITLKNTTYLQ